MSNQTKYGFQTEIKELLDLMIHSLYSNKEIFLRELISNASDALDKLNYLNISDTKYKSMDFEPRIDIKFDDKKHTITISDNGIGMDKDELIANLGTIAKSGTKSFLKQLSGDKQKDSALIGQFGVGFYSSFMVASKIVVTTKKPLYNDSFCWISDGSGEYEILECQKDTFGTEIVLHLKNEEKDFANKWKLQNIIKKYSSHIQFPIFLHFEEEESGENDKDKKLVKKQEQQNDAKAIWKIPRSDLKKEDYEEFYKTLGFDKEAPLCYIHSQIEGNLEYQSLFYIPKKAPFDLYRVDYQSGVKLYVKRVFITDDDKELLPQYLRFVKGIIDSQDLPLNVSREILQQNKILSNIKSASTKKILSEIQNLAKDEEKYHIFWSEFGKVLKEGLYSDFENKDKLLDLARFNSLNEQNLSLKKYAANMQKEQKSIYYLIGKNADDLKSQSILEKYKKANVDVLLLSDEIDSFVMPQITEFELDKDTKIPLKDASSKEALSEIETDAISEEIKKDFEALIKSFKDILGDEISEIELTRNVNSPLMLAKEAQNPMLENLFAQMGQEAPKNAPKIWLNIDHQIILDLKNNPKNNAKNIKLLFNLGLILSGSKPSNVKEFSEEIFDLIKIN
ncbi:MAG: molecular chaperone HtpG [Helicobacter sp.]|nr:molecular chaperone HtpG [Helicobacter sp.]